MDDHSGALHERRIPSEAELLARGKARAQSLREQFNAAGLESEHITHSLLWRSLLTILGGMLHITAVISLGYYLQSSLSAVWLLCGHALAITSMFFIWAWRKKGGLTPPRRWYALADEHYADVTGPLASEGGYATAAMRDDLWRLRFSLRLSEGVITRDHESVKEPVRLPADQFRADGHAVETAINTLQRKARLLELLPLKQQRHKRHDAAFRGLSAQIDAIDALRRRGAPLMQIQMCVTDFYERLYAIEAERSTPIETEAVLRFAPPSELGLAAPTTEAPTTHEQPDDSVAAAPPPLAKAAKANGTP